MGIFTFGPHPDSLLGLASIIGATTFIETGTYKGTTARWASEHFEDVHTIELSKQHFDYYSSQLADAENIHAHFGDSRQILPDLLENIESEPVVFWLDGHWSGGKTAGSDDQCPVIDELNLIKHRGIDLIMIDDARLFMCAPPEPLNVDQWPNVFDIASSLGSDLDKYYVQIFNDTIFLAPRHPEAIKLLQQHARQFQSNHN